MSVGPRVSIYQNIYESQTVGTHAVTYHAPLDA